MKKSWEGVSIEILQNLTVIGRSLSDRVGNESIVLKGVMWTFSQGLEAWRANAGGSVQLTQLSAEC